MKIIREKLLNLKPDFEFEKDSQMIKFFIGQREFKIEDLLIMKEIAKHL